MSKKQENYLDRVPVTNPAYNWRVEENGLITLEIENKGVMNRIAQKLFKKPKISYVHLDEFGSFVWQQIDGKKDITAIGENVDAQFGENAHPLYERLATYFQTLYSYGFIKWA